MKSNKIRLNISDFYILLWVIMDVFGIFRIGESFTVPALGMVLLMSLYYDYELLSHNRLTPYLKSLNILVIMFTLYGVALMVLGEHLIVGRMGVEVNSRTYLRNILMSLLPIFPFYSFALKGYFTERKLKLWFVAIFVISYFVFMARQAEALESAFYGQGRVVEETTNNAGYLILALMPAVVLYKNNKILFYGGLAFCMVFVLMGMKRGAIMIGIVCTIVLLFDQLRFAKSRERIIVLVISIIFMAIAFNQIMNYYSESSYFQLRVQQTMEGNTSSRSTLWGIFWEYYINEDNILTMLIGLGANGTLRVTENFAHNDWLEILINQGLVGFCIYVYYWVMLLKEWRRSKKVSDAYMGISIFVIIFFMKTFFSMSYNTIPYYSTLILGYYLVKYKKNEIVACNK